MVSTLSAGEGPNQLLDSAGSLPVVVPVLVEGTVPLDLGGVPGNLADVAHVSPENGAGHQTGGVLHSEALILTLRLAVCA